LLTDCKEKTRNRIQQKSDHADVDPVETPSGEAVATDDKNKRQASGAEKPSHKDDPSRSEAQQCEVDEEKRGAPNQPKSQKPGQPAKVTLHVIQCRNNVPSLPPPRH